MGRLEVKRPFKPTLCTLKLASCDMASNKTYA